MRLAHTDWLFNRLRLSGPPAAIATLRAAARGAGTIPWHLDPARAEEDFFHLLMAPPAPQARTLSAAGARVLAGQLAEAMARRHAQAVARVGRSHAAPFDLHALLPVPADILGLGPDHPDADAWLWTHWGTTAALRHVTADATPPDMFSVAFWSADWSPWRAVAALTTRWPTLSWELRPGDAPA